MSRTMRLISIAAVMTLFLIGMVVDHAVRRTSGTEVILDLQPVDPRDLLAGYYIVVSTPLHRLSVEELAGDDTFDVSDDIYVIVEEVENGSWQPISIHRSRPDGGLYIHGKVQRATETDIRAEYNLERFYADQDTALALDQRRREDGSSMRLILSVGADGRALIHGIEIDGERQIVELF